MPAADVDILAGRLADWAARARAMPPSFAGAGDRLHLCGPNGQHIGWGLPGEGIAIDLDLNRVGITKPIPGVYERSRVQRWLDRAEHWAKREIQWWKRLASDTRGAISTYDGIIAARGTKATDLQGYKLSYSATATAWTNTFRAGGYPAAGSYTSGSGATHNSASAGAWSAGIANPSGGDTQYLLSFGHTSSSAANFAMLVDLLVAAGGLSATSTSAQTINTTALSRYTTGAGVQMALEVTTALGGSASNVTASYTNQANTSGQTSQSIAMTPSAVAQALQPAVQMPMLPLASGDYGVREVASITLSGNMGSGALALLLYKPLAMIPGVAANVYIERELPVSIDALLPLPVDGGGAVGCLTAFVFPTGTSTGNIGFYIRTCAG